jgi:GMP synthase-like glutamine amidotransferase
MPACLVVQHVEPEACYALGQALRAAAVEVVMCRTYAGDLLPPHIGDFDGLVVMGGPMSAVSDEGFRTRGQELRLLAEAVDLGLPTLGICLGAQLLAVAGGGRVLSNPGGPEIGWGPVLLTPAAADDLLFSELPLELTVLHWHGDTCEPPPGAVHLASSPGCHQQAFRMGDAAWGLQFHLEVDEAAVEAFLGAFGDEARAAGTTSTAIRRATPPALVALRPHRERVLARFAALVALADRAGDGAPIESLLFPRR